MKRDEVLDTAKELINGSRAKDYGDAFDNFERIATGWNAIIREAQITHGYVTEQHVALMMDWLKTATTSAGRTHGSTSVGTAHSVRSFLKNEKRYRSVWTTF